VSFVLVSNDWSQTVYYAEGLFAVLKEPRKWWGFALNGKGTLNVNYDPDAVGIQSKPFGSNALSQVDITIRVAPSKIAIEVMGITIVNPGFAPLTLVGVPEIRSGLLYGLEETPADAANKADYPKTLWALSLQRTTRSTTGQISRDVLKRARAHLNAAMGIGRTRIRTSSVRHPYPTRSREAGVRVELLSGEGLKDCPKVGIFGNSNNGRARLC
jgi:hypothetical protein